MKKRERKVFSYVSFKRFSMKGTKFLPKAYVLILWWRKIDFNEILRDAVMGL